MIRVFGHYVSPALLGLLGAESLLSFGSFVFGPVLWRTWSGGSADPDWIGILPKALAGTLVLSAILIALGLFERQFWRGRADMLLRVGVGFLFGLFTLALVGWLFPILAFSRGELSLALGLAGAGVLLARCGFLYATGWAVFRRRVLVVGVGEQAARLENLYRSKALSCRILGYVQVHEDEPTNVPPERRLQVTHRLVDLAAGLQIDEVVVALDDQRRGFPLDELLECKLAGIAIRPVLAFVERETGQIALEALWPSSFLFAEGFPALFGRLPLKRGLDLVASLGLLALTWPVMLLAALAIGLESGFREPILYRQTRGGPARPAVRNPQVPHHAGRCRRERRRVHPAQRSPHHAVRPVPAGNPHRRTTPVGQRAAWRDEFGRAAPGTAAVRGRTAGGDSVLRAAAPGSARSHRLGADLLSLRRLRREFARETAV